MLGRGNLCQAVRAQTPGSNFEVKNLDFLDGFALYAGKILAIKKIIISQEVKKIFKKKYKE